MLLAKSKTIAGLTPASYSRAGSISTIFPARRALMEANGLGVEKC